MALRIQGKHFASKSELIIDPFPELQTTLVRAKSECSVGGRLGEVARQDIRHRHIHVQEFLFYAVRMSEMWQVVPISSVQGCARVNQKKCIIILLHVKYSAYSHWLKSVS